MGDKLLSIQPGCVITTSVSPEDNLSRPFVIHEHTSNLSNENHSLWNHTTSSLGSGGLANGIEVRKRSLSPGFTTFVFFLFVCFFGSGLHPNRFFLLLCVSTFAPPSLQLLTLLVFLSGQFGWRRVQLPHSPSHPRPFLPCLPPRQLPLHPSHRCSSDANYSGWRATPPRLGNGQDAYRPAVLPQVRFDLTLSICLIGHKAGYLTSASFQLSGSRLQLMLFYWFPKILKINKWINK